MEKFKKIIGSKLAPEVAVAVLGAFCAGFALGLPGEIGGALTILSISFLVFRWQLK